MSAVTRPRPRTGAHNRAAAIVDGVRTHTHTHTLSLHIKNRFGQNDRRQVRGGDYTKERVWKANVKTGVKRQMLSRFYH